MNRKVLLLIMLGCMVCVGTLMFAFSDENLKLKKSHSFQQTNKHNIDGYWSTDSDCQGKCKAAGGMSCGSYHQNCCVASSCRKESGVFSDSFYCDQRVTVEGCTRPK